VIEHAVPTIDRIEEWVRRDPRNAAASGGLGNPHSVARIHGTFASLSRSGSPLLGSTFVRWAAEEGWSEDDLPVLRGVALAAEAAMPDLGELTTTRAADGQLVVHLTRDEALTRRPEGTAAPSLRHPESEFNTLMGFRPDEAEVVLDALGAALSGTAPDAAAPSHITQRRQRGTGSKQRWELDTTATERASSRSRSPR
jgi:hypothetical protein